MHCTGRFTDNGWQAAEAVDMMAVYNSLPGADIQRLVFLDMLLLLKPVFYLQRYLCYNQMQLTAVIHCIRLS